MDNLEKLATLGIQDTRRRQTKQETQQRKLKKDEQCGSHQRTGSEPRYSYIHSSPGKVLTLKIND